MAAEPDIAGVPRRRLAVLAAVVALSAAAVVGLAWMATRGGGGQRAAAAATTAPAEPLAGSPAIVVEPVAGMPDDPAARVRWAERRRAADPGPDADLRLAAAQQAAGDVTAARATLAGSADPSAQAALALLDYDGADPAPALAELERLAAAHPDDPFVAFSRGEALIWAARREAGQSVLRALRDAEPETFYGRAADDFLHPSTPPGYPPFVTAQPVPAASTEQVVAAAKAHPEDVVAQIDAGAALLAAGRRLDAVDAFDAALAVDPSSVEARVGRIIATYAKDHPERSFGQMGPLVRDHPTDPSPRLHLALMLIWIRDLDTARAELRQVAATDPGGRLGRVAQRFLDSL